MYSDTLIDRALKVCGSAAELGRRLGMSRAAVSKLKMRSMKLSTETAALLAGIVHDDPHYAMETVAIEMAPPDLASRLQAVFHRPVNTTGAGVMSLTSDVQTGKRGISRVNRKLTVYTLSCMKKAQVLGATLSTVIERLSVWPREQQALAA